MKRYVIAFVALVVLTFTLSAISGCGANPAPVLVGAQTSHDLLALAQDEEIQLCLGVPNVAAANALPVVNKCSTDIAKTIGLTDARHQSFQRQILVAMKLEDQGVRLAQAGSTVDVAGQSSLQAALTELTAVLGQLSVTPEVAMLTANVKAGVK